MLRPAIIVAMTAPVLAACVTATPINIGPDVEAYFIECGGIQHSMSDCLEKANEVCPGGYHVAGMREQNKAPVATWNQGGGMVAQGVSRSMAVACIPPDNHHSGDTDQ